MKRKQILILTFVTCVLLIGVFSAGVLVGHFLPGRESRLLSLQDLSADLSSILDEKVDQRNRLFLPFWQAWDLLHKDYIDQPVDDQSLMRGAIRGMLESLGDDNTSYMDPDQYDQVKMPLEGSYEGIGAWVETSGDWLTIVSPMPNSPAEDAGLRAGDQIQGLDGEDVSGMPPDMVLRKVLGPAGTAVKLTIYRPAEGRAFDVEITRRKIEVPSVESKMIENKIGYIRLFTFGKETASELRGEIKNLLKDKPEGIILDLRNNGGGYLGASIDVISEFIPAGEVALIEEKGDGGREFMHTSGRGTALDIPLIVLVNGGSASASEITAGAIQDHKRGLLVGETTFGKGSVQNWLPLQDDQGAVRITVARWLTPLGRQINKVGLEPDIVVALNEEDAAKGRDTQLERAVEILKSMNYDVFQAKLLTMITEKQDKGLN